MKVIIFCGGKGTRLREETEFRPKPMVPIGDRPILWHIMKIYAHFGHKDFILCLGYKGEVIKEFFRNYRWLTSDVSLSLGKNSYVDFLPNNVTEDWSVTLAETGEESMTAERLRKVEKYIGSDDTFLMTYGDGLGDVDINAAIASHISSSRLLTITAVHPPGRFGELSLTKEGGVIGFDEKPQTEVGWINGGFFVVNSGIFEYIRESGNVMLEKGPLATMAHKNMLSAYKHYGFWQPMDTYQEYIYLNKIWREGAAPWKVW